MYRVEWLQTALDELAGYWVSADPSERQAITNASHELEQQLRTNAPAQGESRPKGRRIAFVPPLALTFRIEPDGKTVTVLHARAYWRRS